MYYLKQAVAIAIVGGADGPTSILVSKEYWWTLIVFAVVIFALFAALVCGFVINLKKRDKAKSIVLGIITFIFVALITLVLVFYIKDYQWNQILQKAFEEALENNRLD